MESKYFDLYEAEKDRIRDMIYKGALKSMKEIVDAVYNHYERTTLRDLLWTNHPYNQHYMIEELLASYIIHCETTKKVPTSGYNQEV